MIYKGSSSGLLLPSRDLILGTDGLRPNTLSEGDHTVDPGGGPSFEAGVIHAWNPDAGSDASGIITDAVGSANMWARSLTDPIANWDGAMGGASYAALAVDHADITDFKTNTSTLTFWLYEDGGSPTYHPLVHMSNTASLSTGDWRMGRNGASDDQQNYVYGGYEAGGTGANPRQCPTGQWNLWTITL